ncbi:NADH-quinone oxidoreductase subunit A [Candidatus Electrothrix sp.]|uniref:NADH-quinone oxidoreductase subunit A n=1 Tax=Candidatus Electrothrix sp. TaxID=2170559 RepID=UPI0040562166
MDSYILIGITAFIGSIFVGGTIGLAKLIAFRTPNSALKAQPFECSEPPIGGARIRFKVAYYIFALLFLIFDIETLFLFPCVKIFRAVVDGEIAGITHQLVFLELSVFICVLFTGLIYAWRKGVLVWE